MDEAIQKVRDQVIEAFKDVPMPDIRKIIKRFPEPDEDGKPNIHLLLEGKRWDDFDFKFWDEQWIPFGSVSAEEFQYYLPSLLIAALDNFTDEADLPRCVCYALDCDAAYVYHGKPYPRFEYLTSLLTPAQRQAVADYFALYVGRLTWVQHPGMLALQLGWLDASENARTVWQAYRDQLPRYEYAPSDDPKVNALVQEIIEAFDQTPYPGDENICNVEDVHPMSEEPAEYALAFRGLPWKMLDPGFLSYHYASLSFFTSAGLRYYLPAFLMADLHGLEGNANTVFHLTYGFYDERARDNQRKEKFKALVEQGSLPPEALEIFAEDEGDTDDFDRNAHNREKCALFTHQERLAIIHFLEWQAEEDEFSQDEITQALENYWRPSLGKSN